MKKLINLSSDWKHEFARFYADFALNDPENAEPYELGQENFTKYLEKLSNQKLGTEEREAISYFWLVNDSKQILGAIGIRHELKRTIIREEVGHIGFDVAPSYRGKGVGKQLLNLGLQQAKDIGLKQVMIVADESNIASRKVIEFNCGQLTDIVTGTLSPEPIARYWAVV
ncbi:GNAT family N-acetyltransferase [Vibrio harveyi]|uniref:GNAT family N-acetyltransferase n=1 Tax=Vibrio harveyi TaxID=669 RepID=UPI0028942CC3|nr:GNAT family N-acetyltransferase [Vibrio harveyi]